MEDAKIVGRFLEMCIADTATFLSCVTTGKYIFFNPENVVLFSLVILNILVLCVDHQATFLFSAAPSTTARNFSEQIP